MRTLSLKEIDIYLHKIETIVLPTLGNVCPDIHLTNNLKKILNSYNNSEIERYLKSNLKHNFKLLKTKHSQLGLHIVYSICINKYDIDYAKKTLFLLAIIYHNVLLNKYIKYCNELYLNQAYNSVKKTNLYRKLGDIKKVYLHLANEIVNKYLVKSNDCRLEKFVKMLYELRHRIAQSLKSVVAKYYLLANNKEELAKDNKNMVMIQQLTDTVFQKIAFYGIVKTTDFCKNIPQLENLPDVDDDILKKAITEILTTIGYVNISRQKIIANLNKLKYIKFVLESLGIPDTPQTRYCLVVTIYNTLKE